MAPGQEEDRCSGGSTWRSRIPEEVVVEKREMPTSDTVVDMSVFRGGSDETIYTFQIRRDFPLRINK